MADTIAKLETDLELLGLGGLDVQESTHLILKALNWQPHIDEKICEALTNMTWNIFINRSFGKELETLDDLILHAANEIEDRNPYIAYLLRGVKALVARSAPYTKTPICDAVSQSRGFESVASVIKAHHNSASFEDLIGSLPIEQRHPLRLLMQFAACGLVERRGLGKNARYRLTVVGREHLRKGRTPANE